MRGRRPRAGAAWRGALAVVLAMSGVGAAGCASMQCGVDGDFGRAAMEVASAAASSRISIDIYADRRTTAAATDTALGDMLETVDQATSSTADRSVDTAEQIASRTQLLDLAGGVTAAIVAARDVVAGQLSVDELEPISASLDHSSQQLRELAAQWGEQ